MPLRLFLSFAVLSCAVPAARASCGAADCPADRGSSRALEARSLRLGYEFELIEQDVPRVYGGPAAVGGIRGHHDEVYTASRVHRLRASYDLTDRLGLELALPWVSRSHQHVHHHMGQDLLETWSLGGLGDLSAGGRWTFLKPDQAEAPALSLLASVEFPTGADELRNGEGDRAEPQIQPGSGSYDLAAGLSSLQRFTVTRLAGGEDSMPVFLSGTYRWNGRGHDRYRVGSVARVVAGTVYPMTDRLGFMAQSSLRVNRRDERGDAREEVEKTGGTYLFLSPGLEARLSESLTASALVQFPVYQWVRRIQLASRWNLTAGLTYRFRL